MVTFAPGTVFPCASVTVPVMPEVPIWPRTMAAQNRMHSKATDLDKADANHFMDCSFRVPRAIFQISGWGASRQESKSRSVESEPGGLADCWQPSHHTRPKFELMFRTSCGGLSRKLLLNSHSNLAHQSS